MYYATNLKGYNMSQTRVNMNARDKAIELLDSGMVDPDTMLNACLMYMSCDDIQDMLDINFDMGDYQ